MRNEALFEVDSADGLQHKEPLTFKRRRKMPARTLPPDVVEQKRLVYLIGLQHGMRRLASVEGGFENNEYGAAYALGHSIGSRRAGV
jgi:hypothetical protein